MLAEATGNARAFAVRARGRPRLLSARAWGELAEIEARLSALVEDVLRGDLRAEPWSLPMRYRAGFGAVVGALRGEPGLLQSLLERARSQPTSSWRRGAPQLEEGLWPFLAERTEHLANTAALALNEPAPFPPLVWHPGRGAFAKPTARPSA